ncbi:DUF5455 family protein [Marinobacterium arenosum]|uniref:DUF5455 family protein n=1 Tax=Marinobacterium arenosum TaxID=2862496 RepID=UPI001C94B87F|nr:DUF5455 family protein [Marinobacterium arenosum]MBY4675897.1 DUF5455 family protein [Marinobacterium arenosum]
MPKLAELIGFLFNKLLGRFVQHIDAGIVMRLTLVGAFVGVVGVGYATVSGIIGGLSFIVSDDLGRAMSWVVPDNAVACIGALVSASIARATIDFHGTLLQMLKG